MSSVEKMKPKSSRCYIAILSYNRQDELTYLKEEQGYTNDQSALAHKAVWW